MPGTIGSREPECREQVIGQRTPAADHGLPMPIAKAAKSDAVAISSAAQCISVKRKAWPMAANGAMRGKARIGGSEMAPNPMAAAAAKSRRAEYPSRS